MNIGNNSPVQEFQNAFEEYPEKNENYGPFLIYKKGADISSNQELVNGHLNHIHYSIKNQ